MAYYKIQQAELSTPSHRYDEAVNLEGHYIGTEKHAKYLCDERGINPQLASDSHRVCSIGFCEREQKWYGWSHRAMYGFGIGSKVKKGDCAYIASSPEELIEDRGEFFADISAECAKLRMDECQILPDRSGIRILHAPLIIPVATSFEEALNSIDDEAAAATLEVVDLTDGKFSIQKCGRGEWEAKTLDDAKQMAIDFADSVS